jgi:pre-rRNA-processing protein TSR4
MTGKADKKGGKKGQSEEERKKELAKLAGGDQGGGDELGEMEWGSVLVFGCQGDCVGFGEEWVGVEWEALLSGTA